MIPSLFKSKKGGVLKTTFTEYDTYHQLEGYTNVKGIMNINPGYHQCLGSISQSITPDRVLVIAPTPC